MALGCRVYMEAVKLESMQGCPGNITVDVTNLLVAQEALGLEQGTILTANAGSGPLSLSLYVPHRDRPLVHLMVQSLPYPRSPRASMTMSTGEQTDYRWCIIWH
jgi:hypothetical protein